VKRSKDKQPRPPGKIKRAIRRRKSAAYRAVRPHIIALAATAVFAFLLLVAAPGWSWLAAVPAGGILAIAGDRYREHRNWHRRGGRAAMRKRRRWQGHATWAELHRKLSLGAVRRNAKSMRPSYGGRTRRLAPPEAGILIGTVKGTK
jgi:hypothetical protein